MKALRGVSSHPTRPRIVATIGDADASPRELADLLGEPLGNVSYHVRELVAAGVLVLVRAVPRRGAVEHYYAVERAALLADLAGARELVESLDG